MTGIAYLVVAAVGRAIGRSPPWAAGRWSVGGWRAGPRVSRRTRRRPHRRERVRPAARSARIAPIAMRSLAAKTASRSGTRSSNARMAISPLSSEKSPCSTIRRHDLRLAGGNASRKPSSRSMPTGMSTGPAIVVIRVRPRATRWCTAAVAPALLSASTYGTFSPGNGRPVSTTGVRLCVSSRTSGSRRCKRHQDDAVGVAVHDVPLDPRAVALGAEQHERVVGVAPALG